MLSESSFMSRNYTDCLRGIAIIFVMMQHVFGMCYECRYFTPFGGIGVAIFLILSGYGLNESYKKSGISSIDYWSKKILRVFIPYAILSSVLAYFHSVSTTDYLLNIFGIKTSYWYVGFLLKQYIIFYIFTKFAFFNRTESSRLYLMSAVAVVVLFTLPSIEAEQAFSFVLGVVMSQYKDYFKEIIFRRYKLIVMSLFVIGISFLAMRQLDMMRSCEVTIVNDIIRVFIVIPIGMFVVIAFSAIYSFFNNNFIGKILAFIGAMSFELYLVHMALLYLVDKTLLGNILFLISTIGLSYIFYKFNNILLKRGLSILFKR